MTDDAIFDRELRAMLSARDPGPAPAGLAIAVEARIATDPRTRRFTLVGSAAGAAAVVAVIAAVIVLAIVVARPISTGPGASPLPAPSAPYTIRTGDGVVGGEYYPVGQVLAGVIAAGLLLQVFARTKARRTRIMSAIGMAVIALVALTIGTSDAVGFVAGVDGVDPGVSDLPDRPGVYIDVSGDSPFTLYLTVTNTSRLPLVLEGLAEPPRLLLGMIPQPRFVGLGVIADSSVDLTTAPRVPFQPTTLAPGGAVDLAVLGMAGQCAISPSGPEVGGHTWIDHIELVYKQLTIRHSASVALPEPVNIEMPSHCP